MEKNSEKTVNPDPFVIGNTVILKKPHPCGCFKFSVLRTGADIKLCCAGCKHVVMLPREKAVKAVKKFL